MKTSSAIIKSALFLLLGLTLTPYSQAQELSGRLKRIKEMGTLVVAHGETAIPFSYLIEREPVGFGPEISLRIADALKVKLGLKDLAIRWNPVTLSTRFAMIATDTVDLECMTTTNTKARQKMVAFSNTFYISEEGIATRRNSGIKDYADLAGKRVAVVRGTTTELAFIEKNPNLTLMRERTNRLAMAALVEGRADAYIAAAPIVAGELLRVPDASPFHIVGSGGYREAFGCMLPKDDAPYKQAVDEALAQLMQSGEMEQIYNKWFTKPIPPLRRNVSMPLNEATRQLYKSPNDTAFE